MRPILLVITSRTESICSGASAVIRRVPLQRLADDDCRILADSVVARGAAAEPAARADRHAADGVPLFVEELAAAALETGQVDPGADMDAPPPASTACRRRSTTR